MYITVHQTDSYVSYVGELLEICLDIYTIYFRNIVLILFVVITTLRSSCAPSYLKRIWIAFLIRSYLFNIQTAIFGESVEFLLSILPVSHTGHYEMRRIILYCLWLILNESYYKAILTRVKKNQFIMF